MKIELRTCVLVLIIGSFVMIDVIVGSESQAASSSTRPEAQGTCGADGPRCETLEVLALGVTYDRFRQGMLWDALKAGTPLSPLREFDPTTIPWSSDDKYSQAGKRAIDAFENAVAVTPMYWGIPSMFAGAPLAERHLKEMRGPVMGLTGGAEHNGFSWHLFVATDWLLSEGPDRLFEFAFQFFDKHTDVPLLFVSAVDGPYGRDMNAPLGAFPMFRDGRYFVELPDSAVVMVLGRRERVERLRKFAWDDKDNDFGQTKIRMAYYDLRTRLAKPQGHYKRHLSAEEWFSETARLANSDEIRSGWGSYGLRKGWLPSPWFPVPWSKEQLSVFDRLPILGYVHRPVFVEWKDAEGNLVRQERERSLILKAGLDKAVYGIATKDKPQFPTRLVTANGGDANRLLILHGALNAQKDSGGPQYDIANKTKFIDTDRRLGNTGAATFFMQAAIGIMGSYREGGVSVAINMRDPNGASIILISPPSDELRARQRHPAGGDVFRHRVEPAYDPEVYKQ